MKAISQIPAEEDVRRKGPSCRIRKERMENRGEVAVEADLVVEVAVGLVAGAGVGVAVEAEDAVVGVAVEAEAVVEAEVAVGVVVEAAAEVGAEVEVIVGAGAGAEVEVAAVVTIEQRRDPVEMFYQIQRVKEWRKRNQKVLMMRVA